MNSGKRLVYFAALSGAGLVLAITDAHAPGPQPERGILIATELVPNTSGAAPPGCAADQPIQRVELRFERITTDPDADEMRLLLSHGVQRGVDFEWNADTGELAYGPSATLTFPADHGAAASSPTSAGCGSR